MAGLKVKIGADASQFERTMKGVQKEVGGVKKSIMGIAGAVGAVWAANKAFDALKNTAQAAVGFMKESSKEAAAMESLTVTFTNMLGSAEAGKRRMDEVTRFAASTPFEVKELAKASKTLQALGGELMATGDGLKFVGNMAAFSGRPIGEVADVVGKVHNALAAGTNVELAWINRLQELGLLTDGARTRFQKLNEETRKGRGVTLDSAAAFSLLQKEVRNVDGLMEQLSSTTEGKLSNLRDNVDQLQVAFGTGFNEGLKDALDAANGFLPSLSDVMKQAGELVGISISEAVQGNAETLVGIGELIGMSLAKGLKIGFERAGGEVAAFLTENFGNVMGGLGYKGEQDFLNEQAGLMREGSKRGARAQAGDLGLQIKAQVELLRRQALAARARRESEEMGMGGFNPFSTQNGQTYFTMSEDMKQVRELVRDISNRLAPVFSNF